VQRRQRSNLDGHGSRIDRRTGTDLTGGSRGIGHAISKAFLDEGARIAICARNEVGRAFAADELAEFGEVHHRPADIVVVGEPEALVDWAANTLGGLDIVVSNVSAIAGPDWEASVMLASP